MVSIDVNNRTTLLLQKTVELMSSSIDLPLLWIPRENLVGVQVLDQRRNHFRYHIHDQHPRSEKDMLMRLMVNGKIEFEFEATEESLTSEMMLAQWTLTCKAAKAMISSSVQSMSSLRIDHFACSYN